MNKEEFLEECEKEGLIIYGTTRGHINQTHWESNLKRLKELKKYKEMWEEFYEVYGADMVTIDGRLWFIDSRMNAVKLRYFPKPVNKLSQLLMELEELVQETLRLLGG